jgi:hypothetical protein
VRSARADRERLFDILDAIQSIKTHIASRRRLDDELPRRRPPDGSRSWERR